MSEIAAIARRVLPMPVRNVIRPAWQLVQCYKLNRIKSYGVLVDESLQDKLFVKIQLSDLLEGYQGNAFAKQAACPICRGTSQVLCVAKNIHPDMPYTFDFRICDLCGHGWIDPMPAQDFLNYLYSKGSCSVIGEWGPDQLTIPELLCAKRESRAAPARYFELGVGQGHLYRLFGEHGWNCVGVDPGEWSQGFPNIYRSLGDVPIGLSADVLAAFDVLEHVADPVRILSQLRQLAAPGATLYCSMPNRLSLRARRDGPQWRMVRPVGHVNYYSKKSITLAMKQAGFSVWRIRATDLNWLVVPKSLAELRTVLVEVLGLGDQLIVVARAT